MLAVICSSINGSSSKTNDFFPSKTPHTNGESAIGAMVKFINGSKVRQEYRKYTIRGDNTRDDLAMMKEVLQRRFSRIENDNLVYPDLIIVDGGENQIKEAIEVIN